MDYVLREMNRIAEESRLSALGLCARADSNEIARTKGLVEAELYAS